MEYFSARLIFIILIDNEKPKKKNHYDESVIVFKAKDYQHAFERTLELGKAKEITYKNVDNQNVRWAFSEISELKCIGKEIDGVEVTSAMFHRTSKKPILFDKQFHPEVEWPTTT